MKVMLTINSLAASNSRLREKTLEKASDTTLTHKIFMKLLSDHETHQNQSLKGSAVARRVGQKAMPKEVSKSPFDLSHITCFRCRDRGHFQRDCRADNLWFQAC